MQRDILCHLIQFQYNISQLNDQQFITFCAELMRVLTRKEIESILFGGLNAMRLRGCRSSLKAKNIIYRGSNITFKIKIKSKIQNQSESQTMTLAKINKKVQFQHIPQYLCNYLCDFLDIQSLLKLQLTNRYFCVISRQHRNYSLLLIISPYNSLQTNINYTSNYNTFPLPSINENEPLQQQDTNNNGSAQSQSQRTNNNNFLHSVNETALNSGYYKKFFIPIKKLGVGSYGSVFLVNHIMHGIYLGKFAMKIICVGDDLNRLIDILREVRTLQQLHHRNVIDYKHSWLENYQPATNGPDIPCLFILMEYADMGSVQDYIIMEDTRTQKIKRKWLTEHEIWTIMFETCTSIWHCSSGYKTW